MVQLSSKNLPIAQLNKQLSALNKRCKILDESIKQTENNVLFLKCISSPSVLSRCQAFILIVVIMAIKLGYNAWFS